MGVCKRVYLCTCVCVCMHVLAYVRAYYFIYVWVKRDFVFEPYLFLFFLPQSLLFLPLLFPPYFLFIYLFEFVSLLD